MLVKYLNTGQACISPNRIFVHRSIVDPFVEELKTRVSRMRAGSGFEDGVSIGPLVDSAALQKVERQVSNALDNGAILVCGGRRLLDDNLDKGCFYDPTVLIVNNVYVHKVSGVNIQSFGCFRFKEFPLPYEQPHSFWRDQFVILQLINHNLDHIVNDLIF